MVCCFQAIRGPRRVTENAKETLLTIYVTVNEFLIVITFRAITYTVTGEVHFSVMGEVGSDVTGESLHGTTV